MANTDDEMQTLLGEKFFASPERKEEIDSLLAELRSTPQSEETNRQQVNWGRKLSGLKKRTGGKEK